MELHIPDGPIFVGNNFVFWHASWDRSVSSKPWYSARSATGRLLNQLHGEWQRAQRRADEARHHS